MVDISGAEFKRRVSSALRDRVRKHVVADHLGPSAVLMPFYEKDGKLHLLFTKRTDRVAHHKLQISFPGGARDPHDPSLLATALRESAEEIGLDASAVEILGVLDDVPTVASRYVITPYVGFLDARPRLNVNSEEVAEVIEVPLEHLLDRCNPTEEVQEIDGEQQRVMFYRYGPHVIWGATARVVQHFLELLCPQLAAVHEPPDPSPN